MIPGTAIPTTRLVVDDSIQSVKPTPAVTDILSEFKPGQRLVAEIQAQLPNGTYRALVSQRVVTLALPFAAKAGDSLELEVVENDGRLAFAVSARTGGSAPPAESAKTTLSATGQWIGALLNSGHDGGDAIGTPTRLNAGSPLLNAPPAAGGSALVPALQKSLSASGVFYESHQASWIDGKLDRAALLLEPQGRLSPPQTNSAGVTPDRTPLDRAGVDTQAAAGRPPHPTAVPASGVSPQAIPAAGYAEGAAGAVDARRHPEAAFQGITPQPAAHSVSPELLPLVQQQLNGLASGLYGWQGLAWPGQRFEWEVIDEEAKRNPANDGQEQPRWRTRLRVSMPFLGSVDAELSLSGQSVQVELSVAGGRARGTLAAAAETLRRQYEAAGLDLSALNIHLGHPDASVPTASPPGAAKPGAQNPDGRDEA